MCPSKLGLARARCMRCGGRAGEMSGADEAQRGGPGQATAEVADNKRNGPGKLKKGRLSIV